LRSAQRLLTGTNLATRSSQLPLGVGFLNWGASLPDALPLLSKYRPAAVWFFAPHQTTDLTAWSKRIREATKSDTQIWVQVGTVAEALDAVNSCNPEVLVVQGFDAGGHGLNQSASLMTLLPEVSDALATRFQGRENEMPVLIAAGGILDARGLAAATHLGAAGCTMGTRYLAAHEAVLPAGYRTAVIRASDGGARTVRTSVYDQLRGTTAWPPRYGGRALINRSYVDAQEGMGFEQNLKLYKAAERTEREEDWAVDGRLTTYAGTGVGLVKRVESAGQITREVRDGAVRLMERSERARL
jgi:nitronate monooxygenase